MYTISTVETATVSIVVPAGTRFGYSSDENDNEALLMPDGSVRLSIKQRPEGHKRVFVRVPDFVELEIVSRGQAQLA